MKIKKLLADPDFIGWMIWMAFTLALAPLFIWLMYTYTYDTATSVVRWIVGIFAAAVVAGLLSMGINELWFRMRRLRGASKRKNNKKSAKGRAR